MYLRALITLSIIGAILATINLIYIFIQKRKYNANNKTKVKNGKNNLKSMREINNQVKAAFIKTVLKTKTMQALLIVDGCSFTAILILIGVFIWIY